jgi:hypothetical protein
MKEAGLRDVQSALSRVQKLWALGRVERDDMEFLIEHLGKAEARIIHMSEKDAEGDPV